MKKISKALSALAVATAALCAAGSANAAIVFSFTPATSHINVGETVVIDASISGLGDEILSALDLNFQYNPSVLQWTLVEYFGANLGNSLGASIDITDGDLSFVDSSVDDDPTLAASQLNNFLLFQFTLEGLADGATTFSLGSDPDFERNFVGLDFASLNVQVGSACVAVGTGSCEVAPVPEPASFALAGVALLAAGVAGRNRRRARAEA